MEGGKLYLLNYNFLEGKYDESYVHITPYNVSWFEMNLVSFSLC